MSDSKPDISRITGTAVYVQKACVKHRFIRSKDSANIVERPERLRAVHIGVAAAVAHLEISENRGFPPAGKAEGDFILGTPKQEVVEANELTIALERLALGPSVPKTSLNVPVSLIESSASVDILDNAAVKFIHGDIEGDVYLEALKKWARDSQEKISNGESEIPEGYSQGDLYLCPASIDAIQGALGTVCEAVDAVIATTRRSQPESDEQQRISRAFVAIRPPGHHCGEDTPSGFCFVNNVAVAAAHAHLKHGMNRIVILDIDLHHGNGTQSIVWQINEESYRKKLEIDASNGASLEKTGPQMFYGSIHDVLSYPCEDGKVELVQAASVSVHGPHGQYVENIHLKPFKSEEEFWNKLYAEQYSRLLKEASNFLEETGDADDDVLIFISCGFDASEHEYPSMSRHGRYVPTSFYYRFAQDARKLAERFARGRLISILEGGYSDRALTSGVMAHLCGLAESTSTKVDESWWSLEKLVTLEKATKKRRGGRISNVPLPDAFIDRTLEIFGSIDSSGLVPPTTSRAPVPSSSRTLRDRKKTPVLGAVLSPSQDLEDEKVASSDSSRSVPPSSSTSKSVLKGNDMNSTPSVDQAAVRKQDEPKKLPRVILKLGPQPKPSAESPFPS